MPNRIGSTSPTPQRTLANGSVVETHTELTGDGVTSTVTVTGRDGARESWIYEDSFVDDGKDRVLHVTCTATGAVSREEGFSPALFLAKRGELFADKSPGVDFGALKLTYSTAYSSAVLFSTGTADNGVKRSVVASLGVHAAFPFPGEHWDEGQIAILDENDKKLLSLRMPQASEEAHLDVVFEDAGRHEKRITYRGYMQADDGKLRFVEACYVLAKADVEKRDPSLWDRVVSGLNAAVGFEQNARMLGELAVPASTLKIDGKEVLRIETTLGSIDDGGRFNLLGNSALTAINYAPESAPLLALVDPAEKQVRYRFDATFLRDDRALLHKLVPAALRRGILAAHYVVDASGQRHDVSEKLVQDGPPLSSKRYHWSLGGKPAAVLTRELVRYRDEKGRIEVGFRESISRTRA